MPVEAPDSRVIRDAVALACRAPSLHNTQPWRWVAKGASLQLWADPTVGAGDRSHRPGTDVELRRGP